MGLFRRDKRAAAAIRAKYEAPPTLSPHSDEEPVSSEAGWIRLFLHGLPLAEVSKTVDGKGARQGSEPVGAPMREINVSLLGEANDDGLHDYLEDIFALSEQTEIALNQLTLQDVLHELLWWDVKHGSAVKEGEKLGSWSGLDILAPANGTLIVLVSPIESSNTGTAEGFPSADWLEEQQLLATFEDAAVDHAFEWTIGFVLLDGTVTDVPSSTPANSAGIQKSQEAAVATPEPAAENILPTVMRQEPVPALIRHPKDAETAAAQWMRYWGWIDARVTREGADEGIDVMSKDAIAQVKAYMTPVGRPDIQNLFGVASAERKTALFFALTGYTNEATAWANRAGVALFRFDLQGQPEPINQVARDAITQQKRSHT
jgi:hypothetical protein